MYYNVTPMATHYNYDLGENLIDTMVFTEYESFTESELDDLQEMVLNIMDDYVTNDPTAVMYPEFESKMIEQVKEITLMSIEPCDFIFPDEVESIVDEIVNESLDIFYETLYVRRENGNTIYSGVNVDKSLEIMRANPHHKQKTPEWYERRHQLLTVSVLHKIFGSQAEQNQLIYEKCQPLKMDGHSSNHVSHDSSLHHGVRYEPLSAMIYSEMFGIELEEFGCISHPVYTFLGASPDGVVITPGERYGRMLEIKCPVSRTLTGIPTLDYWTQVQGQLEVCNLECGDLFETRYAEYESWEDLRDDLDPPKYRGIIAYFVHLDTYTPTYKYYICRDIATFDKDAIETTIDANGTSFIKFIYWKLIDIRCTLIWRNYKWFEDNIATIVQIWDIICKERVTGSDHRAPKKRTCNADVQYQPRKCMIIRRVGHPDDESFFDPSDDEPEESNMDIDDPNIDADEQSEPDEQNMDEPDDTVECCIVSD